MEGTSACSLLTQPAEIAAKNINKRSLALTSRPNTFIAIYINGPFLSAALFSITLLDGYSRSSFLIHVSSDNLKCVCATRRGSPA